jgi:bacillithiol biosynthesis cysteine-adding enzyme BshC
MNLIQRYGARYRPHNKLITAFNENPKSVEQWLRYSSNFDGLEKAIHYRKSKPTDTAILARVLQHQYEGLSMAPAVKQNLDAFAAGKALTVTTGHQLCLWGGPAYFMYKIISTISLAQAMQARHPQDNIVPVFWMASEDHDKEEIAHCYIQGKRFEWHTDQTGPVGRFANGGIQDFIDECSVNLKIAGAEENLIDIFTKAHCRATLAEATRDWVNTWFGENGLIIIDADDADLKSLFKDVMLDEVLNQPTVKAVNDTSVSLQQEGYTVQVNPREINLFYMTDSNRLRIERDANGWITHDRNVRWSKAEITNEIEEHPERFSPNVIMRPLYQERILPNLAYVGGPGEIAYWLQLKAAFEKHKIAFPALLLRDSALIITPAMSKRMTKLGISVDQLFEPKDSVLTAIINFDETLLDAEMTQLQELFARVSEKLSEVDPTLTAAAAGEAKRATDGLENLKSKVKKAIKIKQEAKVNQLNALWNEAFPDGQSQDRSANFFSLAAGNEREITKQLLSVFNPLENKLVILQPESSPTV